VKPSHICLARDRTLDCGDRVLVVPKLSQSPSLGVKRLCPVRPEGGRLTERLGCARDISLIGECPSELTVCKIVGRTHDPLQRLDRFRPLAIPELFQCTRIELLNVRDHSLFALPLKPHRPILGISVRLSDHPWAVHGAFSEKVPAKHATDAFDRLQPRISVRGFQFTDVFQTQVSRFGPDPIRWTG
jgi:hypothetical protein